MIFLWYSEIINNIDEILKHQSTELLSTIWKKTYKMQLLNACAKNIFLFFLKL